MSRVLDLFAPAVRAARAEDQRGDIIMAGVLFAIALTLDALGLVRTSWDGLPGVPTWWFVVPTIVGCTALIWRRVRPLPVLGVATVAFAADITLGGSVGLVVVVWEALYAVHLHGRPAARRVTALCVATGSIVLMIAVGEGTHSPRDAVLIGIQAVTLLVMPMWWGANVRQGRELTAAAHERGRLERERSTALLRLAEASRHDAVRAERTTVARDLHDVVASHLSAITITSGAALAGPAEPERDRAALRSIRAESLASLQDMQAMIRVLRAETGQVDPVAASRAAQLGSVVDQARLAGLDLTVTDPDGVLTGSAVLPAAVDHAVYRVVRESLTNVHKHGGTRAELLVHTGERLEIEVCDAGMRPGDPPRDAVNGVGTGLGLVSMRERVESLGGSFDAGQEHPGWRVRAVLPLPEPVSELQPEPEPEPVERASAGRSTPGPRA